MNFSYWELKSWFTDVDFAIVGSGIVGLSCALHLKIRHPKAKIVILEKGMLPQGASTKNAGFACFGSLSELLDDVLKHSEEDVFRLVKQRWEGLQLLRATLGDATIGFKNHGGYELFLNADKERLNECLDQRHVINQLLKPIFKDEVFTSLQNPFGFKGINETLIFNPLESQIETGKMMEALLQLVQSKGVKILNNIKVKSYSEQSDSVLIETDQIEFSSKHMLVATNGFASQLISEDVKPARAQVLITKPISGLSIKGTFHLDQGYYYFRNIDDRILLGGGRNLDFKTEETTEFGQTERIQRQLETLLKETILPTTAFEIEQRWSGIMGMGQQKTTIVKQLSNRVYCGVRLGGMGIAIGSSIGKQLAELIR